MIQLNDIFMYCLGMMGPAISDYNKRLILLSVIQLSGRHSILLVNNGVALKQNILFILFILTLVQKVQYSHNREVVCSNLVSSNARWKWFQSHARIDSCTSTFLSWSIMKKKENI